MLEKLVRSTCFGFYSFTRFCKYVRTEQYEEKVQLDFLNFLDFFDFALLFLRIGNFSKIKKKPDEGIKSERVGRNLLAFLAKIYGML